MTRQAASLTASLLVLFALACAERTREQPPATTEPVITQGDVVLMASLYGAAEVPGPGDTDGSGSAHLTLKPAQGEVCFEISVADIGAATAAHIHAGAEGQAGAPVVDLDVATKGLNGCVSGVSEEVMTQLGESPSDYYINVHTAEFGGGAIRGQLALM